MPALVDVARCFKFRRRRRSRQVSCHMLSVEAVDAWAV